MAFCLSSTFMKASPYTLSNGAPEQSQFCFGDSVLPLSRDSIGRRPSFLVSALQLASPTVEMSSISAAQHTRGRSKKKEPELELVEPDFYNMGYMRHVRAYGIQFKEGSDGIGVYAAKDILDIQKPRTIMEIPMELMVTVSQKPPWMFFPDIVPLGHPVFDVVNSTNPEADWDIRLACLLLLALDQEGNFWRLYSDYLPDPVNTNDLLLASEEELSELQDEILMSKIKDEQIRAEETWSKHWLASSPLKLRRLASDSARLKWALSMAWSRSFTLTMTIGSKVQAAHLLIPYADMLNHSFTPTCSYRWRTKDCVLEIVLNAGQSVHEGDEMTLNYMGGKPNRDYMHKYGFSSSTNPWEIVDFSGGPRVHLDSFLSAFNISGLLEEYYYNESEAKIQDGFMDGAVLAAARTLPTWSEKDLPFLPSIEKRAVRDLQRECRQILQAFPTTWEQDNRLKSNKEIEQTRRWQAAIKYRMDIKYIIKKIYKALDIYLTRILY